MRLSLNSTKALPVSAMIFAVLLLTACQSAPHGQATFQRMVLAERVSANGQLLLADLGGSDAADIVLMSRQPGRLSWFENPGWQMRELPLVADVLHGVAAYSPPHQQGPAHLAVNGRFSQPGVGTRQQLLWLQNPAASSQLAWSTSLIRDEVKPGTLLWADMTGNGRQILVTLPDLDAFTLPRNPSRPWGGMPLIKDPLPLRTLRVFDWDLDGRDDLLIAGEKGLDIVALASRGWFVDEFNLLAIDNTEDTPASGFMDVGVGRSGHSPLRFVATLSGDASQLQVYRPHADDSLSWVGEIVSDSLESASTLKVVDLNQDNIDEIVVGHGNGLTVYYFVTEQQVWRHYSVDESMAVADVQILDMTGNGFPDIVTAPAQTGPVLLFLNRLRN